ALEYDDATARGALGRAVLHAAVDDYFHAVGVERAEAVARHAPFEEVEHRAAYAARVVVAVAFNAIAAVNTSAVVAWAAVAAVEARADERAREVRADGAVAARSVGVVEVDDLLAGRREFDERVGDHARQRSERAARAPDVRLLRAQAERARLARPQQPREVEAVSTPHLFEQFGAAHKRARARESGAGRLAPDLIPHLGEE